jgi:hypothetical protein
LGLSFSERKNINFQRLVYDIAHNVVLISETS